MVYKAKTPIVMIVEDDRDIAAYYRHVMDLAGYRTEIAQNGRAAIEQLIKNPPDMVLLDLNLPGVSGVEVHNLLKSDERFKKTREIVITGYAQEAEQLPVEPDLILLKPISPLQLADLVERLFQEDANLEKHPFGKNPWDKATSLYNRSFFINRLEGALRSGKENQENLFAVILVSLDQEIIDHDPQEKKQKKLSNREIAGLIKASVRPTETIARFIQGQFYILVENIHGEGILAMIANRIQQALANHPLGKNPFGLGAILCDGAYADVNAILADVKSASVFSRKEGQSRYMIFSRESIKNIDRGANIG